MTVNSDPNFSSVPQSIADGMRSTHDSDSVSFVNSLKTSKIQMVHEVSFVNQTLYMYIYIPICLVQKRNYTKPPWKQKLFRPKDEISSLK